MLIRCWHSRNHLRSYRLMEMFFLTNREIDMLEKTFIILTKTSQIFIYKRIVPWFQCLSARLRKIGYVIAINYYVISFSPRNLTLGKYSAYIALLPSDVSPLFNPILYLKNTNLLCICSFWYLDLFWYIGLILFCICSIFWYSRTEYYDNWDN